MGGRGRPKKTVTKIQLAEFIATTSRNNESNKSTPNQGAQNRDLEAITLKTERTETASTSKNLNEQFTAKQAKIQQEKVQNSNNTSSKKDDGTHAEEIHIEKQPITIEANAEKVNKGKSWANLVVGNTFAARGMRLSFVAPVIQNGEKIVELQNEEIEKEAEKWKTSVIMYVVGVTPSIRAIERFIASQWNFVAKPKVYHHNDGFFVVRFKNEEERNEVLYSGPCTIQNRPVITKAWTTDFDFNEEVLKTLPLWVKLPNLPLNCWGMDSLSRIGSRLGIPIYADECITRVERISYARILVEMGITKPLPTKITVKDPNGRQFDQPVVYDWKPIYCSTCLQLGHNCQTKQAQALMNKQQKMKPEWKPKEQEKQGSMNHRAQEAEGHTEQVPKLQNAMKATMEENKGWKAAKGKSATKNSQAAPAREILVGNGFDILTEASSNDINKEKEGNVVMGEVCRQNGRSLEKAEEVRYALKRLNTKEFKALDLKVRNARQRLQELQGQMGTTSAATQRSEEEKELKK
ncbi:uncharacterized protein [Nicotiana sylvestris]|uniref:Uncharacterized protein LOC104218728 n=1 Tax=Nicotiana sylvestris TaxID=4096 RepID=A0A1U7VMK2_NICSY|nr:PREDICTED: uncharacterized protein LOC104218728 [Nicotiana sylvestris]